MVKKLTIFVTIFLLLFPSTIVFAAKFSVSVDKKKISLNETIVLDFKLDDTYQKEEIDFSPIISDFRIISEMTSISVTTANGSKSSRTQWILAVKPKKTGNLNIPEISLKTKDGLLTTASLPIEVTQSKVQISEGKGDFDVAIESSIDESKIYQYQTFLYTIKLYTTKNLQTVEMPSFDIENAILKANGQRSYNRIHNGQDAVVIEYSYIIIPIKDGLLKIPELEVSGSFSELKGNGFAGIIQNIFNQNQVAYNQKIEEFLVKTKPLEISILPPEKDFNPWIPAKDLFVNEKISEGDYFVGQPITRVIKINTNGLLGKQIPEIKHESSNDDYTIYQETPQIEDKTTNNQIRGSRTEIHTIMPKKSGEITIPAINIKWWDTKNSMARNINISERVLNILPANNIVKSKESQSDYENSEDQNNNSNEIIFYITSAILSILFIALLYEINKAYSIFHKSSGKNKLKRGNRKNLKNLDSTINTKNKKVVTLRMISSVFSDKELYKFLQEYGAYHSGTKINESLDNIFKALSENSMLKQENYDQFIKDLEGSLYFAKKIDIQILKDQCKSILKLASKKKRISKNKYNLPELNPR